MFKNPNKLYNYDYFKTATPLTSLKNDDICDYIHPLTNTRCKKYLGKYPRFCSIHTSLIDNVFISKSNIKNAGNGLFAGKYGFKKNDVIGVYSNEHNKLLYSDVQNNCNKIKDDSCWEYTLCDIKKNKYNDNTICWDGIKPRSTIHRYINDAFNTKYKNNSFFIIKKKRIYTDKTKKEFKMTPVAYIIASKKIDPYEEILVSYGKNYWS
jgi:hypothetical protein